MGTRAEWIKGQIPGGVDKVVADDAANLSVAFDLDAVDARVLDIPGGLQGNCLALLHHDLAGLRIQNVPGRHMVVNPSGQRQLLIVFIPAHPHQVISFGIKEEGIEQIGRTLQGGRFTRLLPLVDLDQALFAGLGIVALLDRGLQTAVVSQRVQNLRVGAQAQRAQNHRDGQLAGAVDPDPQHIVGVRLILQPGAPVGDNLGGIKRLAGLVQRHVKIHARRTDELADDDAFRAINNEGTMFGHQGEVAHEHVGFLDFSGFTVLQSDKNFQRSCVGQIPLPAAGYGIFGFIQ